MSQQEKLVARLLDVPADFSWDELVRVLSAFGYEEKPLSGSHRRFFNPETGQIISGLVKPHHPRKHVGRGYLRKVIDHLNLKANQ
jgi:predicted RNA binding protein YcfA (HicA-like mRNA interferase family)